VVDDLPHPMQNNYSGESYLEYVERNLQTLLHLCFVVNSASTATEIVGTSSLTPILNKLLVEVLLLIQD
jgi:hypothetical protein